MNPAPLKKADILAKIKSFKYVYACVDWGSGSFRMDVIGVHEDGRLEKVRLPELTKEKVNIGVGISKRPARFRRKNLGHAKEAVARQHKILKKYGFKQDQIITLRTAAFRAIEDTPQGIADIRDLSQKYGGRSSETVTQVEEALLNAVSVRHALPDLGGYVGGKRRGLVVVSMGKGSIQCCVIKSDGTICHPFGLPYGLYPIRELSHNTHAKAARTIARALDENYPSHEHKVVALTGGLFRALGEAHTRKRLPVSLRGRKHLSEVFRSLSRRGAKYFQNSGSKRVAERAYDLSLAAAVARPILAHFKATKAVFLDANMRDGMALQAFCRDTEPRSVQPGLERLFSPSAPKPAFPV